MDLLAWLSVVMAVLATAGLGWQVIKFLFPWIQYDVKMLSIFTSSLKMVEKYGKRSPQYTILERLIELAHVTPRKKYIIFEDEAWTYQQVNDMSNQVARVMHDAGIKMNTTVALMMISRPEFVGTWFGIGKTGATTAFINYNIRGKSLLHCLKVSDCRMLVISNDKELVKAVMDIEEDLKNDGIVVYILGDVEEENKLEHHPLHTLIETQSKNEVPKEWRSKLTMKHDFCYVYTSGTTGLPKAAVVRHGKAWLVSRMMSTFKYGENDVIYSPLPLYHAASGLIGILCALKEGCSVVIRRKFSASQFWVECRRHKATIIQYIGETIRYICDQPPHEDDKNHSVRVAIGNGLRPQVWEKFRDRFGKNIQVIEFYAATEGNMAFMNLDNHLGSVGLLSPLIKLIGTASLIKYDREKDEPVRNANGRCVEVPFGVPGLLIGQITTRTEFHGYRGNKKQTENKIMRNVFKEGDEYFNTGDMLKRDDDYHMYFVDRVGDTFRWKGENVSTNEVADVMSAAPGIQEANVYGVEIPGVEGRAGMMVALLQEGTELECSAVYKHACDCLASYARPHFIRIKQEMDLTGTFKLKKVRLVQEGFEPKNLEGDKVYYLDAKAKEYVPLTQEIAEGIINKKIRI